MKWLLDILKGIVIGIANIIPGVSGGTMMVSMGIYDTLIHCITHLFKQFKKSVLTLLPYAVGMLVGIVGLASLIKVCLANYQLPTQTCFIGLILGGLPVIVKRLKGKKTGFIGMGLFALFFALIIILQVIGGGDGGADTLTIGSVMDVIMMVLVGVVASATMVIPGVSGSMMLMLMGYYKGVIGAIDGLKTALFALDFSAMVQPLCVLLPLLVGIVIGIFGVAKLIEVLLAKFEGYTFCAILGLVAASPIVLLMANDYSAVTFGLIAVSVVTFAVGFAVAWLLTGKEPEKKLN